MCGVCGVQGGHSPASPVFGVSQHAKKQQAKQFSSSEQYS